MNNPTAEEIAERERIAEQYRQSREPDFDALENFRQERTHKRVARDGD